MNPILSLVLRVVLHGAGLLVALLPRSWEMALGPWLGRLAFAADPKRRRIALDNIRRCLPELGPAGWEKLLRENYEHYGVLTLELAHLMTPWASHWPRYAARVTRNEGFENFTRARAKGKGVLFCSLHMANWELMSAAVSLAGGDLTINTRHIKPEWLHLWWEKVRLSAGVGCLYQPRTMPGIMRGLRDHKSIGFVMDQYMVPPMGQKMRFFGVEVDTLGAIAPLARRTGAAIVPIWQQRDPDGIVRIIYEPEVPLEGADAEINQRLNDRVEGWIRRNPAQWLWVHRRFKNVDWSAVDRKTQPA